MLLQAANAARIGIILSNCNKENLMLSVNGTNIIRGLQSKFKE